MQQAHARPTQYGTCREHIGMFVALVAVVFLVVIALPAYMICENASE